MGQISSVPCGAMGSGNDGRGAFVGEPRNLNALTEYNPRHASSEKQCIQA